MSHQSAICCGFNSVGLRFSMLISTQILARNVVQFRDTPCKREKMNYEMPWMTSYQTKQGQNKKCCMLEAWGWFSSRGPLIFIAPRNPQDKPIWSSCPMGNFTHFPLNCCSTSCWLLWYFLAVHACPINIHSLIVCQWDCDVKQIRHSVHRISAKIEGSSELSHLVWELQPFKSWNSVHKEIKKRNWSQQINIASPKWHIKASTCRIVT